MHSEVIFAQNIREKRMSSGNDNSQSVILARKKVETKKSLWMPWSSSWSGVKSISESQVPASAPRAVTVPHFSQYDQRAKNIGSSANGPQDDHSNGRQTYSHHYHLPQFAFINNDLQTRTAHKAENASERASCCVQSIVPDSYEYKSMPILGSILSSPMFARSNNNPIASVASPNGIDHDYQIIGQKRSLSRERIGLKSREISEDGKRMRGNHMPVSTVSYSPSCQDTEAQLIMKIKEAGRENELLGAKNAKLQAKLMKTESILIKQGKKIKTLELRLMNYEDERLDQLPSSSLLYESGSTELKSSMAYQISSQKNKCIESISGSQKALVDPLRATEQGMTSKLPERNVTQSHSSKPLRQ